MKLYSTGEAAERLAVSRDSLVAALRGGAPDTAHRMAGRRVFTEANVERLAEWYKARETARKGTPRCNDGDMR